jgi:hypothetical protein
MKSFAIALGLMASVSSFAGVIYSNTADLSTSTTAHKIWRAKKFNLATKTEIRQIPGCIVTGDRHPVECQEEVALERTPVLMVDVEYKDAMFQSEGNEKSFVSFILPVSNVGKKLTLSVKKAERTIQIVDVRNSKLCPIGENYPEPTFNCREVINYKPAKTWVKEVSVHVAE